MFMQYKIMMCCPLKSTYSLTMPHMPWNPATQTWHLAENNKRRELWVNIQPYFPNTLFSPWFPFQYCVYNRVSPGVFDSEQVQTMGCFISRCIMLSQQPSNGLSFNFKWNHLHFQFNGGHHDCVSWLAVYWLQSL